MKTIPAIDLSTLSLDELQQLSREIRRRLTRPTSLPKASNGDDSLRRLEENLRREVLEYQHRDPRIIRL